MTSIGTREQDPSTVVGTREHADHVTKGRFPAVRDALQWLTFSHLPEALQNYSRPFYLVAVEMITSIKDCPELNHTLNGLIAAKDWAVRAGIRTDTGRAGSVPRPREVVKPPLFGADQAPARPDQMIPRPLERD